MRVSGREVPVEGARHPRREATQGQMDGFLSQLPHKRHLEEVATVRY